MESNSKIKKRIVISYKNLTPELQDAVKLKYPYGYTDKMIRIDKGPNDFFYAIMLDTEDISYLIKVDVKIDDGSVDEEEEKEFFDDDIKGAEDISDESESEEE